MEKPISESDESGFIYAYRYRLPETENHSQYTLYKVGRTINVLKRLYQWDKQCKYNPELIETFPMIVLSTFNKQIINCKYVHRAERLIHIELKARFKADTEKCKNCGRMHQEWFKVTNLDSSNIINGMHGWDEIHKIIVHWISYIEKVYG
ncbi:MAG TPA: GIY-YIG nuclease family protein [Nitrososphaeraceae archaeon]|nr:GIY-YIG nuclease family protein [Nitrososphaeraceae archaeon]